MNTLYGETYKIFDMVKFSHNIVLRTTNTWYVKQFSSYYILIWIYTKYEDKNLFINFIELVIAFGYNIYVLLFYIYILCVYN